MPHCGRIFLCIWFFCLIGLPAAQARLHEGWTDLGLFGGQILSLASDPRDPAIAYAGSWDGDGLFRSTDGGRTWVSIPEDEPSWFRSLEVFDIAVHPRRPGTLWVANSAFVNVSRDHGATWETFFFAFDELRFCYAVAVDPHDPAGETVYVGTGGPDGTGTDAAIYKTADGGRSWHMVLESADHDILDIAIDPLTPGRLWAIAAPWLQDSPAISRVLHSRDGGTTWSAWDRVRTPQGELRAFGYLDAVHVWPAGAGTVFTCGQNGIAAFESGSAKEPEWVVRQSGEPCNALCFEQPASIFGTAFGAFDRALYTSPDGWLSRMRTGSAPDRFICMEHVSGAPGAVLAGGRSRGIFQSQDTMRTWQARNHGIRANTVYTAAVSPLQPDIALCGTQAGAFVQHHPEAPWQEAAPVPAYAFAFHPAQPATWYAGLDHALGKALDHGAEWSLLPLPGPGDSRKVSALSVIAETPPLILAGLQDYAGLYGAIIRLPDTGGEFAAAPVETVFTAGVPVNAIAHHPGRTQRVFAGTGWFYAPGIPGGLYASIDQGSTWHASGLRDVVVNSIAIAPDNPDLLYAACGDSGLTHAGIFKSSDGGRTWEKLTRGLPPRLSATDIWTAGDGTVAYAALYSAYTRDMLPLGGIYATRDGGGYWTQIGLSDYLLYALACRDEGLEAPRRPGLSAAGALPDTAAHTLLAGSSSGLYRSSTLGAASLTGSVACAVTGAMLDSVVVSASCGANCITADGYYLMLLPPGTHTITAQAPGYVQQQVLSVTVLPSGQVTRHIDLQPASAGGCPVGSILRARHRDADLDRLRRFRAQVLLRSPLGRRLAGLYSRHAGEIRRTLEQDPAAARHVAVLIARALPAVDALLAHAPGTISPELAAGVPPVLAALEQSAGPVFRRDLQSLRTLLKNAAWPTLLSEPGEVSFTRRRAPRPVPKPDRH